MTRTQRFLRGFVSGYFSLIVATAAGLWLTPFFLRHLGQSTYGLWLVGTQVIAYLMLMDLGIVALLPRETAYITGRTGRTDAPELRPLVEKALALAVVQTPLVAAAALAILCWLPEAWVALRVPLTIILGVFCLTFPLRVFQGVLTGLQDLAFVARAQFGAWAAGIAVNVWLVLDGDALSALAAGWCVTQLSMVGACVLRVAVAFPAAGPRRLSFLDSLRSREYLVRSGWISIGQVAQVLLNGTDVMIVAAVLGPAAVVPYACTGKLIAVLANQPQAILQSAAPALSELRSIRDRSRMSTVSAALAQITLATSGLVACVILAVNAGFVAWWVGPEQYGGAGLTVLLLAAMIVRHFNTTNVYALFCFAQDRRLALTAVADGTVSLSISYVLVTLFGIAGAPLGALAGVILVSIPLNLAALSRESGIERSAMVSVLGPWLWRFALMALVSALAGARLSPTSFASLAVTSAMAAAVYVAAIAGPVLRSPAGPYLRPLLPRRGTVTFPNGDSPLSVAP